MTENPESGFKYSLANLKPADSSSKVKVTFPDGATREYPNGTTGLDIAKGISPSLAKRTVAMARVVSEPVASGRVAVQVVPKTAVDDQSLAAAKNEMMACKNGILTL